MSYYNNRNNNTSSTKLDPAGEPVSLVQNQCYSNNPPPEATYDTSVTCITFNSSVVEIPVPVLQTQNLMCTTQSNIFNKPQDYWNEETQLMEYGVVIENFMDSSGGVFSFRVVGDMPTVFAVGMKDMRRNLYWNWHDEDWQASPSVVGGVQSQLPGDPSPYNWDVEFPPIGLGETLNVHGTNIAAGANVIIDEDLSTLDVLVGDEVYITSTNTFIGKIGSITIPSTFTLTPTYNSVIIKDSVLHTKKPNTTYKVYMPQRPAGSNSYGLTSNYVDALPGTNSTSAAVIGTNAWQINQLNSVGLNINWAAETLSGAGVACTPGTAVIKDQEADTSYPTTSDNGVVNVDITFQINEEPNTLRFNADRLNAFGAGIDDTAAYLADIIQPSTGSLPEILDISLVASITSSGGNPKSARLLGTITFGNVGLLTQNIHFNPSSFFIIV